MAGKKTTSSPAVEGKPASRKKRALGRGLDALFPDIEPEQEASREFFLCDTDLIFPNRFQSRSKFSEKELAELVSSIKKEGVIQPILVRRAETGYELVAGERRLRAAKMAGLTQVPVFVREISDQQHLIYSIVENVQRENLNPLEEAEGYQRLLSEFGFSQEQIATSVGKSRSAVANFLRLRQLPEAIRNSINVGEISMGHARALLGAKTPQQQQQIWKKILRNNLSVRQTEEEIKQGNRTTAPAGLETADEKAKNREDRHLRYISETLSRRFGTKVQIKQKGKKRGRLEIEFYSPEDLSRLLELLGGVD